MINFHGENKNKNFFEGWYFKHEFNGGMIAFIPGINIDNKGIKKAFIQVITKNKSYNIPYSFKDFKAHKNKLYIKIGDNIFSENGISININTKELKIKGYINYYEFTPIKYDIMGPFAAMPFMECNHGVISLFHKIDGEIILNDKIINLNNGRGYIEKDFGTSFPKSYTWIQCNDFKEDNSIMVSIADIPFMGRVFKGCIAVVYINGREYRLATYNGVKILAHSSERVVLKRGKYRLEIKIKSKIFNKLLAPQNGDMSRIVQESLSSIGRFEFYCKNKLLLNEVSNNCSFEFLKEKSN